MSNLKKIVGQDCVSNVKFLDQAEYIHCAVYGFLIKSDVW